MWEIIGLSMVICLAVLMGTTLEPDRSPAYVERDSPQSRQHSEIIEIYNHAKHGVKNM